MDLMSVYINGFLIYGAFSIGYLHAKETPAWRMLFVSLLAALVWPPALAYAVLATIYEKVKNLLRPRG